MVNLPGPMRKLVVDNPNFFTKKKKKKIKFKITYSRRLYSEAPFILFGLLEKKRKKKNIRKYPSAI